MAWLCPAFNLHPLDLAFSTALHCYVLWKPHPALAVSVIECDNIKSRCTHIEEKIRKTKSDDRFEVVFFDAKSKGCWVNP
jgi:hypothetical protein